MKFFDYKFVIILGLSMVVYFLYREIELLGKRVNTLENKTSSNMNELDTIPELELPLPPKPSNKTTDIIIPLSINKNNISVEKSRNDIIQLDTLNGTVEEYSNEVIYSNDMIQSNTIEHDTIMVDSIVNMVNNSDEQITDDSDGDNRDEEIRDSCTDEVNNDNSNIVNSDSCTDEVSNPISNIVSNNIINDDNIVNNDKINNDNIVNNIVKDESSTNIDTLLKHKLNELQTMAKENNISLNITGTSKKKTKLQLAQELSNKKNI